jgi:hypothetical protein
VRRGYLPTTDARLSYTSSAREDGWCCAVEVSFLREPGNQYERNAFRAEINGRPVGHLAGHFAAQLAAPLDPAGCSSFSVASVVRGGWLDARNFGVHVWLNRRTTPGPEIDLADDAGEVDWRPRPGELS